MCERLVPTFASGFFEPSGPAYCMNANLDMAISHVNTGPDYFSISGILITIALMCLSLIFLANKAKLSVVACSSEAFPSISAGNAPLMMHDEARGEAGTVLTSSPILQPGMDNSPTLESSQSLSRTLSQSPKPSSSAVVRLYLPHMGNNNNRFFRFWQRATTPARKTSVAPFKKTFNRKQLRTRRLSSSCDPHTEGCAKNSHQARDFANA